MEYLKDKSLCNVGDYNFIIHSLGRSGSWLLMFYLLNNNPGKLTIKNPNNEDRQLFDNLHPWSKTSYKDDIPALYKDLKGVNDTGHGWIIKRSDKAEINEFAIRNKFDWPIKEIYLFRKSVSEQTISFLIGSATQEFHQLKDKDKIDINQLVKVEDSVLIDCYEKIYRSNWINLSLCLKRKKCKLDGYVLCYEDLIHKPERYFDLSEDVLANPYKKSMYDDAAYQLLIRRIKKLIGVDEIVALNTIATKFGFEFVI